MLRIDPASASPPYEQLRAQFAAAIAAGELPPGSRLPTVRRLAGDLGLAPNTVARSFRQLETDGLIETRGRLGSFVARQGDARERRAADAALLYLQRLRELGLDGDDAERILRAAMAHPASAGDTVRARAQSAPESPPLA
ncbi:GntR family transcriptional regulator [Microterricola gilva]|uniref:GntR family transcriptional regulator n=1 Tax=Microterricola gilva TaxID=393267 RepID=A0A4Q8AN65_9MICO|nr:GntR family transcriptional regulator [Microterricola gilva]RZU65405.1 GntR family transcriptional regulator [Microterricola gilva]